MKNICLVTSSLVGGGAEKKALEILQYLNEQGYNAHLIVLSSKKIHFDISNIENIWFADKHYKKPIFGFMELQRKAQALDFQIKILEEKFGRFDLILASLYGTHRLFAKLNYEQVFYSIHSDPWVEATHNKNLSKKIKSIASFKRVYKNKKIVCVSKGIKDTLVNKFSLNEKDITVIYNPFNFDEIIKKSTEYEVAIEHEYIVHVGRFHPQKRHDILFESYKKMNTEHKLVLLCHDSAELRKLIAQFNLQEKVYVAGFQQNPYPYIKKAKLLLLTSDYEGLPTVLIEALILSTPVVSTDCPTGPNEILTGELSNFLAKYQDADDVAEKALKALDYYPVIPKEKLKKFSFEGYVEKLKYLTNNAKYDYK